MYTFVQRPNSYSLTGDYSRFWHRVVVPGRQPICSLAGRYDNLMPESTISLQSGTKNFSTIPVWEGSLNFNNKHVGVLGNNRGWKGVPDLQKDVFFTNIFYNLLMRRTLTFKTITIPHVRMLSEFVFHKYIFRSLKNQGKQWNLNHHSRVKFNTQTSILWVSAFVNTGTNHIHEFKFELKIGILVQKLTNVFLQICIQY